MTSAAPGKAQSTVGPVGPASICSAAWRIDGQTSTSEFHGFSLLASDEARLAWWALRLVGWFKSTPEERWMLAQHPGYAHCREQTKRFVPWEH